MKCRLCLSNCEGENVVPLFNNDEESNLTKLIAKYLYIEVTQHDVFSRILCKDCIQHLNEFHRFFQHVEQQQQVLQKEFFEVNLVLTQRLKESETNIENNEESLLDIKDVINEDETCLNRTMSEKEFCYADDLLDRQTLHETESEEDVPLQKLLIKTMKSRKNRKLTKNTSPNLSVKKLKCSRSSTRQNLKNRKQNPGKKAQKDTNTDVMKDSMNNLEEKMEKPKKILTTLENKLRDEMLLKYVDLKCEICTVQVDTYDLLKLHFRKEHNRKAFFTCCGKRFLRRSLLLDHIQSHLNPEHFKCKICDKILKSRVSLNLHNANMHVDRELMKHACSLCGKRFKHPSNLSSHMQVHIKEKNFVCDLCKKAYKSSNLLKMHIQHMHGEKTPYICETCGKEYRFKLSFDRHVAEHQGKPKEKPQQCKICGNWYTRYNLRRHMKRHILEEVNCETCGKTFKSKVSLKSHIKGSHQKREKIYTCTFCDKTFERPRYLKEHIDMHTGQKQYKCAYCEREFRSRANMYSHVKKIHNEQWAEAKLARSQSLMNCIENENFTKND